MSAKKTAPPSQSGYVESENFFIVLVFTRGFPVKVSEPLHNHNVSGLLGVFNYFGVEPENDVRKIKTTFNKTFTSLSVYSRENRNVVASPASFTIIIQMTVNSPPSIYGLPAFVNRTCRRLRIVNSTVFEI